MNSTQGDACDPAAVAPPQWELALAPDERWWPGVAALVRDLGQAADPVAIDLRRVVVVVPSALHAPMLRDALHAALDGKACIAPRIVTLEAWTDLDANQAPRQRAELFQALRESAWVRERFGSQAGALWSLARDVAFLSDELTLAACGAVDAFEGRWRAAVQRSFSQRAAAAGEPQSQLVLALWHAGLSAGLGAARLRESLERRARRAEGPLVWLAPQGAAPWQKAYCQTYAAASGQRAVLVVPDLQALAAHRPWLLAAWPELAGALEDAPPIALRARALAAAARTQQPLAGAMSVAPPPGLHVLKTDSLEEEAAAAADWTVERLREGCRSIALVALDRLTARRVRALLDRVGVLVADESGWKLSTTSAAAALMRWIDLVISDFAYHDLLDWLQSPFTLSAEKDKAAIVESIGAAMREEGVLAGIQAVRAAVARRARTGAPGADDARRVIDQLTELARSWQRPGPLGRFLGLLTSSLDRLGMRSALAGDPVGRIVLSASQQLHDQLVGSDLGLDLAEFRAFLAEHFEELGTADRQIASPVAMTTLADTRLRRFDAALLVGADADHLPGRVVAGGLLANSVRRELGLRTDADREREQSRDLAALVAATANVAATWRSRSGAEPRPLSPLLDRLALLSELAGFDALLRAPAVQWHRVPANVSAPRCPRAAGLLPQRVSASAYQDLVDCPYRFFALRLLGLRETTRIGSRPQKRDFGLLLHAAMLEFHRARQRADGAADSAAGGPHAAGAQAQVWSDRAHSGFRAIVDGLFAPLLQQQPALIGYRQRLRMLLPGYLAWLRQSERDGWRWLDGEVSLRRAFPFASGVQLELQGRIDRVDINPQGQLRVLDYKSRDAASLRKAQKDPGEDVQLLFYGLLQDPPPGEAAYLSLQRPPDPHEPDRNVVTLVPAPGPLAERVSQLASRLADDLGRVFAGASLPANGAAAVCRRCELRSLCRYGFTAARPPDPAAPPWTSAEGANSA